MNKNSKIFIAGHRGLVGSAICRCLIADQFKNLLIRNRVELDLTNQAQVEQFFNLERPEYVILAAAKVGGIHANDRYPAQFIHQNLMLQTNVIDAAWRYGVKRLLFLGSSCIYPKLAPQPIVETALLTGPLEPTNEPYAIAKIAGIKMCESYNRQYGTHFISVMPTNLYGPEDNFDLDTSHVLPALLRKFHEAKVNGHKQVVVWGSGKPRREFLHVDDMAAACVFVMNLPETLLQQSFLSYPEPSFVNVGTGTDVTIAELAEMIREEIGYAGEIFFDRDKPDGAPRKLLDVSRLSNLGWQARIDLQKGISATYQWFLKRTQED